MTSGQFGIALMAVLWLLLCLRFWLLVGPKNPGQRHLLAIAGGLGAGLIYVLGTLILGLLKMPSKAEREQQAAPASGEEVRISPGNK